MKSSITAKNTMITSIADSIQEIRVGLNSATDISLSSEDTRRIVLICTIYLLAKSDIDFQNKISINNIVQELGLSNVIANWVPTSREFDVRNALQELHSILKKPDQRQMIEYALEALEYDEEQYFSSEINRGVRNGIHQKKKNGIYYTPEDVVSFMVDKTVSTIISIKKPRILDCSCGTGIFLKCAFETVDNYYNADHSLVSSLDLFHYCIWGIDISPAAIENCLLTFIKYFLDKYSDAAVNLATIWNTVKHNLFVADATQMDLFLYSASDKPRLFDCIIGNPPYVSNGPNSNLFIPFVNNIIKYSSVQSCSALVLPLSFSFSQGKDYIHLREKISSDSASWLFYHFDRSPDSLFGDQVKTRNTIVIRSAGEKHKSLYTTGLKRWTSENRSTLFKTMPLCNISGYSICDGIPKLSSKDELVSFLRIRNSNSSNLLSSEKGSNLLVINGTVYNWICAYDHYPPSTDENGQPYQSSTTKSLLLPDEERRDFLIALLSNRIIYWYWTAISDGFHISPNFINNLDLNWESIKPDIKQTLSLLGKKYSQAIKTHPQISYNAKKTLINYSHWVAMDVVKDIEFELAQLFQLEQSFLKYIDIWYSEQVKCGRLEKEES